jgi:hypothetical protein
MELLTAAPSMETMKIVKTASERVVVVPLMLLLRIQGVDSLVELPPLLCSAPWT